MKQLTNTPHDKNFKLSLSNKEVAKDFLCTHLPKSILKTIKLSTLKICPDSYITPELEENYSDVIYSVKTNKNHHCYIYNLIEHMSTASWDLPIRFVEYQLSIIANHRRQHPKDRKIPVVIPLLVYNGIKSPYPKTLDITKLFNNPTLAKTTFAQPAHLIDLTIMSDQLIKKHNIISLLEFTQKHVRDQRFFINSIKNLVSIINKLDGYVHTNKALEIAGWFKDYVYGNLHYLFYYANISNDQEFIKELEKVKFIKQEGVMGVLARKIEQQGIEKNKREVALSMVKKGLDINLISEVTKMTVEEVTKLKESELEE